MNLSIKNEIAPYSWNTEVRDYFKDVTQFASLNIKL